MVGRIGPARAAESCRGALEMGWRDCWRPSRATHNSLPCPPIGRFSLTLRGHNSGPFAGYVLKFRLYPAYVMPSLRSLPQFGL